MARLGNASYVTMIALAIMAFLLSVLGNLSIAKTAQDIVIYVVGAALMSLAIWGIGWVIRYVLGGGPAK
jgi:hypothetical protein